MPSNNSKYTKEIREQTAAYILESEKSASSVAEDMGIDKNTVCKWVRDYRREHKMPTYAEERGITSMNKSKLSDEARKIKELERENKRLQKQYLDEEEKVEILKKSLHIFMQPQE